MTQKPKIKISFKPKLDQLNEIEKWLIDERNSTGNGFYCNWNIIKSSYDEKKLAIISEDNRAVGFITWSYYVEFIATIEITEIKPTHRNRGLGKQLVSKLTQRLISKNFYVIKLQCSPSSSEPIWRHLGFTDFPKHDNWNRGNKELFKILVPHLEIQKNITCEYIELWNDEPYCTQKVNSTWKWNLSFKDGTRELEKPIIQPCHYDWRIRWANNNLIFKDEKVKRFGQDKIDFGGFLIIQKMPELD
jgi:GNAT superfamily N-acetyltransferase